MSDPFSITVTDFKALHRNTLRGFATILISELHLTVHDITIHQHGNGKRWVGLPGKPMIDNDGVVRRNAGGKIEYAKILGFDSRPVSDAFSAAVIKALIEFDASAFDAMPTTGG